MEDAYITLWCQGKGRVKLFTWHSVQIRKRWVFLKTLSFQCWDIVTLILLEHVAAICSKTAIINVWIYDVCEMSVALQTWISCAVLNLHNCWLMSSFVPHCCVSGCIRDFSQRLAAPCRESRLLALTILPYTLWSFCCSSGHEVPHLPLLSSL